MSIAYRTSPSSSSTASRAGSRTCSPPPSPRRRSLRCPETRRARRGPWLEVELGDLAPAPDLDVLRVVLADGRVGVGHVGDLQELLAQPPLDLARSASLLGDAVLHRARLGSMSLFRASRGPAPSDALGHLVLALSELVQLLNQAPSAGRPARRQALRPPRRPGSCEFSCTASAFSRMYLRSSIGNSLVIVGFSLSVVSGSSNA